MSNSLEHHNQPGSSSLYAPSPKQNELFQKQIRYAAEHSPFYRKLFKVNKIDIANITLDNFSLIPCTTKEDIQHHEKEFLCIPPDQVVEYVTTSGTLGSPVTFMLSESDLKRLALNEFNSLSCAGITAKDVIQIMVTLDKRFMAGMAYYQGARAIGAGIVRTGVESLDFQLDTIHRIRPTVLIAVPSFIIKLIDHAQKLKVDLNNTSVEKIICIGEPIRRVDMSMNTLGQRILDRWNVKLFSTYASTEMATAFTECVEQNGGHHQPEMIVTEILDEHGNKAKPGEPGELVVTPLGIEGMPLIRFKTGDICRQIDRPCPCGISTYRIGPVEGRKKQMIKLKGTSLYPPSIFDVLNGVEEISQYVITLKSTELNTDHVLVEYCSTENEESLLSKLKDRFRSYIRVVPELSQISPDQMKRKTKNTMARKSISLLDLRDK